MSWQDERSMSKRQYKTAVAQLGVSLAASGRYVGFSPSTVARWARGDAAVPVSVALLLRSLIHHGETPVVPKRKR